MDAKPCISAVLLDPSVFGLCFTPPPPELLWEGRKKRSIQDEVRGTRCVLHQLLACWGIIPHSIVGHDLNILLCMSWGAMTLARWGTLFTAAQ
ncbi:uncharacterized [Tachysurus ichikawai]